MIRTLFLHLFYLFFLCFLNNNLKQIPGIEKNPFDHPGAWVNTSLTVLVLYKY